MNSHCASRRLLATNIFRRFRGVGTILLVLAGFATKPDTAQAAPTYALARGDYAIANLSNQDANDFHAQLADGRASFKRGFTDDAFGIIPWFPSKVITPAQSSKFDWTAMENNVPVPPLAGLQDIMVFSYTSLAYPGLADPKTGKYPVDGGLDPKNTYLTANGAKLARAFLQFIQ